MLSRLVIKNIALIDNADIYFDSQLNILSGETGSGKSVILDSINFILGSKADKTMIRYGEKEAQVRAEFLVAENSEAFAVLNDLDIECDGNIIITRKFNVDGKGSIKVNGNTVSASMLRMLTQHLVDVHGQSEHFVLLNESNQLKVIDGIAKETLVPYRKQLTELINRKKELRERISSIGGDEQSRERRLDILDYQIKEIEAANLQEGEYSQLLEKRNLIINSEKIITALNNVKSLLSDDNGAIDTLSLSIRSINTILSLNENYAEISDRLENALSDINDIVSFVEEMEDDVNFDEEEANLIEERISLLKNLRRKYGSDESEILKYLDTAQQEYEMLQNSAEVLAKLQSELSSIDDKIFTCCTQMTEIRKGVCQTLCENVVKELQSLNIPSAKFCVEFKSYDKATANLNSCNGSDEITFLFSANKGEPLKPLSKVISGGEMSRFMLAIKTQLKSINGISTYIFDEIDSGISGSTAKAVAEKFIDISKNTQIIAVSHLPQVCASSSKQFLIYKEEEDNKTYTRIKALSEDEKVDEIIRLTGSPVSQSARTYAKELINQYK